MPALPWDARDYAKHSSQQHIWARELIGKLNLRGNEHVLDIGCGDGKVTAEIAAQAPDGAVMGIDSSPSMVALAQQLFPPEDCPNLLFMQADARDLPFCDEFTIVFSNAVLHWVRDHGPVLRGVEHSLRSGGRALLQMGGRGNVAEIETAVGDVVAMPRWRDYFVGFEPPFGYHGPDDYTVWLRQAGLAPLRVELFARDAVHPGRDGLAGWLRTTHSLPYAQRLPESDREPFVSTIVDCYLAAHPLDSAGNAHVRMVRLEVEALKP